MINKKLFLEVLEKKLLRYPEQLRAELRKEMLIEFESFKLELS
jgi:hypothetical protein